MREVCLVIAAFLLFGGVTRGFGQEVEGVKVVRKLTFKGNKSLDEKTLRTSIVTQQAPLFYRLSLTRWIGLAHAPVFDPHEFQRDVLRVQALYGVHGFPEAKVDTTLHHRGDDLDITFLITEGRPIVVDSVDIVGLDTLEHLPNVRNLLPLRAGNPFDRIAFQTSVSVLEALLRDRGHPFAHVTGGFQASNEDPPRSVRVTLTAESGPRARIAAIDVEGTEAIDKRVVLKTLMIKPGEVYSDSALHEGMMNLQKTELFRQVRIGLADTAPSNPHDTLVDVHVRAQLAEYPLRRARVSFGYGTLDCMRTMGSVDLFNFSGEGRRLEFRARTSQLGVGSPTGWGFENGICNQLADEDTSRLKVNYNLALTLHDPLIGWNQTTAMATLFFERHTEFGAYLREAVGGELTLTRQIATDLPLEGSYSFSYGRTLATPATFCALLNVCSLDDQAIFGARRRRSVVSLQLVRDRSNSVNDPTQGSTLVTELRVSPAFLGSAQFMRFIRFTGGYTAHIPIGTAPGRVFNWRIRAGTIFAPNVTLPSGGGIREYVPPEERLFAGGSTTVRGFPENQLGPVVRVENPDGSTRTSATGGTFMVVSNAEVRFPLRIFGVLLFGATFVDAGIISERRDFSLSELRITPGAGLRMPSLLGPIRLDIGFNPYAARKGPLYRQAGDQLELVDPAFAPKLRFIDRLQLHLSIGQAF
jgi:outer membrane protein insertion porin family/translocation and assembly module TamA